MYRAAQDDALGRPFWYEMVDATGRSQAGLYLSETPLRDADV